MRTFEETLRVGDLLDQRFAQLRGQPATSKRRSLVEIARVFVSSSTEHAVVGGIALQVWADKPRATVDVEIALRRLDELPRDAMTRAGFVPGSRFEHSENWTGPDGTPVQFSDEPAFNAAISHAWAHPIGGTVLRVAPVGELIRAKLRAARDPARRRSKRLMDIADATALAERHPQVLASLTADERRELGM